MRPFLVDPSSRATEWLKTHLKEQRLEVINQQVLTGDSWLYNRDTLYRDFFNALGSWLYSFSFKSMPACCSCTFNLMNYDLIRLRAHTRQCLLLCVVKESLTVFTGYPKKLIVFPTLMKLLFNLWLKPLMFLYKFRASYMKGPVFFLSWNTFPLFYFEFRVVFNVGFLLDRTLISPPLWSWLYGLARRLLFRRWTVLSLSCTQSSAETSLAKVSAFLWSSSLWRVGLSWAFSTAFPTLCVVTGSVKEIKRSLLEVFVSF